MTSRTQAVAILTDESLREAQNAVETFDSYEQMLGPAPKAIALLGQLMLVATEKDFTLEKNAPKNGFQYLKYPNSFRASLVQMTNIGWEAFNEAHVNMDKIRLHSSKMVKFIPKLNDIILHKDMDVVERMVPIHLKTIKDTAEQCKILSAGVATKFTDFMKATAELLEASTNAKGGYERNLRETDIAIRVAEIEEEHALKEKESLSERYKKINEEIDNAQKQFNKILRETPSTKSLIFASVADAFVGTLRAVSKTFTGSQTRLPRTFGRSGERRSNISWTAANVYKFAEPIHQNIQILSTFQISENDTKANWDEINAIQVSRNSLQIILNNIQKEMEPTSVHQDGIALCTDAIRLCNVLIDMSQELPQHQDPENITKFKKEAEKVLQQSNEFLEKGVKVTGEIHKMKPEQYIPTETDECPSIVQAKLNHQRMMVDATKELLQDLRVRQQHVVDDMKECNQRLEETLKDLAKFGTDKINFEIIIKTLHKGIEAIAQVREQWFQLCEFFSEISNIVEIKFHGPVMTFIDYSEQACDQKRAQAVVSDGLRQLIYEQSFDVSTIAFLVHAVSSMYVDISKKYLMEGITCVGGLIALDPSTEQDKIIKKRNELSAACQNMQKEIEKMVTEKKQTFQDNIDSTLRQIEADMTNTVHKNDNNA